MAREFNYKRAWQELAGPEYDRLPQEFRDFYQLVATRYRDVKQEKDLSVTPVPEVGELVEKFDGPTIAWAAEVISNWGHWGYCDSATVHYPGLAPKTVSADMFVKAEVESYIELMNEYGKPDGEIKIEYHHNGPSGNHAGAHWKVERMLKHVLTRKCPGKRFVLDLIREKFPDSLWVKMEQEPNKYFMDHKEGTKWDTEELPARYQHLVEGAFEIRDVKSVNFKPHPFMIGTQHFPKDGGMYIKPEQAPCAMRGCGLSYANHTYDVVMFLMCTRQLGNKEAAALLAKLVDACKADKARVDGFAFVTSPHGFEIDPPEGVPEDVEAVNV